MESLPSLEIWDWLIIAGFFVCTLVIGLYFSRRAASSLDDYFVAGRKMTWWIAGTSIVATSFAADTPLVISQWTRTVGLERNWFWWGGIMGMMLCTFFFARLWRRARLLTDVELTELRYAGLPAAGLRFFHASYRSLIQNTLVMGWVTLAMIKILDVTLDIPTLVFVSGQWLPEVVPKGVEVAQYLDPARIAHWPIYGLAIIPAKTIGIVFCFGIAAIYSTISGLWGVMATDFFQFALAMTGTIILMIVVFVAAGGPVNMVDSAIASVQAGQVRNAAPRDRATVEKHEVQGAVHTQSNVSALIDAGLLTPDSDETLTWSADGLTESDVTQALRSLDLTDGQFSAVVTLWREAYTTPRSSFTDSRTVRQLVDAGILMDDTSGVPSAVEYYRFPTLSITEDGLRARIEAAGVRDSSEVMAAWGGDQVVRSDKVASFLPPFDLKGGGLLAVWSLVVFLGLQWWAGGEGGGFLAQRLFSCKNERHSVLAMLWFNLAHFVLRPWPWIVVGVASLSLVPDVTVYGHHYDAEHAYVIMLMKYLPVGLKGLMIAALMAAYMSTISTHINFGASYIVNDLYRRFINRRGSERSYVMVSKAASIVLAVLAGIYAFYSESIATGWFIFFELMSGAGFAVLLRWYWWRINAWSELSAMASSLSMYLLLNHTQVFHTLLGWFGMPGYFLDEYAVRFTLNLVVSTAVWLTVTWLTPPEPVEHLARFYQRVGPPGWWKPVAQRAGEHHLHVGWVEWAGWFCGVTGLFAMIFCIGQACFGRVGYAVGFGLYGALATAAIFILLRRMDWSNVTGDG